MTATPRPGRLVAAAILAATLALGADGHAPAAAAAQRGESSPMDFIAGWKEVDRLVAEDKLAAAAERAAEIRLAARQAEDAEELTRALVREVQLRTALHGYETTVRFLIDEEWPDEPLARAVLDLFHAHTLLHYWHAYSWEISQRERVDTGDEVDLRRWTRDQIYEAAQEAYLRVWEGRDAWGAEPLGTIAEYVRQNDYPPRIRGTLRDAVTYLWVELLSDTTFWRPEQQQGLHRLDLERLVAAGAGELAAVELADADTHPLLQIAALLADLEAWHAEGGRPEAAFEARRVRLERLFAAFDRDGDRQRIRAELERRLDELGQRWQWWSLGMATLAEMVRQESGADALVRARDLALAAERAHPDSAGGRRARHLVASLEATSYQMEAMALDGPSRRSLRLTHQGLEQLHFRAYRVDLRGFIESSRDYNLLPAHREVPTILARQAPDAAWTVDLSPTPDLRPHVTYVVPPMAEPGLWVVVASARRDFATAHNQLTAVNLVLSDLILVSRPDDQKVEVTVRRGASGAALAGVAVHLYRHDWQQGHRRVATATSDAAGRVRFELTDGRSHFLLAEHGDQVTVDLAFLHPRGRHSPGRQSRALVSTDRSVYRPHQEVLFKVVAYGGDDETSRFVTLAATALDVELVDANHQVVETLNLVTNDFGTASGSFRIPPGRLLGAWQLRTSLGGGTPIRVEEYQRPTFEVTLEEPEGDLRLNRPASLAGEARYYFGLPVGSGEVRWRVMREPLYPPWWWWYGRPRAAAETVAAGSSELAPDGGFTLDFTPEADEREAEDGVSYLYRVSAEVTAEGGETRAAERVFRLGFVAVEMRIETPRRFFAPDRPLALIVHRHDLDGNPRAGGGSWRLVTVRQPDEAVLPADQPLEVPPAPDGEIPYRTPGDLLRPRWDTAFSPAAVMRQWPDGEVVAQGSLAHGDDGVARLELPPLPPGLYRLRSTTSDAFGSVAEAVEEIVVAADGAPAVELPLLLLAEEDSVPVGGTLRLLVSSGLPNQEMVLEITHRGQRVERRTLGSGRGAQIVEIPVRPEHRGGFGVGLTAVRDYQLLHLTEQVFVPWSDRELEIELLTFRDRLRPGTRETWTVVVRRADGEPVGAEAAEVLASMYDRSLDLFAPHRPPLVSALYPRTTQPLPVRANLGVAHPAWGDGRGFGELPPYPHLVGDALVFYGGYGIGGLGRRGERHAMAVGAPPPPPLVADMAAVAEVAADGAMMNEKVADVAEQASDDAATGASAATTAEPLRNDFAETAFFHPHLLTAADGTVRFELTVPDSVTEWTLWLQAITRDLAGGFAERRTRSVKELMVRPYLPRFLREGDRVELEIAVDNAGEEPLSGQLTFDIVDPESGASLLAEFGLGAAEVAALSFTVEAGGGTSLTVPLVAPVRVGLVAIEVRATAGSFGDGERRPLPLLPGRMHLAQSRSVTLHDPEREALRFADLAAAGDDPTLLHDQLVVTVDAQLFYGVLEALPYLVEFPYECTEQTLNRFVSTGIVSGVFDKYPAVAAMAAKLAAGRDRRLETWQEEDPNRQMALVETPWLVQAQGGDTAEEDLIAVLDPQVARAQRDASLAELAKAQTSLGGFPWWPGGPPSPYMTVYMLHGLAKALEHGVEVPPEMVRRAWGYLHRHYVDEIARRAMADDCCWELVTFLAYTLSAYPDDEGGESWTGGVFTAAERRRMLDFSFRHWRDHSPLSKAQLALALHRAGRAADARLVFDSLMDSARTTEEEGTFWAPEERSWLWYNDTVEGHAWALRALTEVAPDDPRRHGLVQWLFLDKQLNHWRSTRATAEVIWALVHYLEREGALGVREEIRVEVGPALARDLVFEPDEYTGKEARVVVPGAEVTPAMAEITVAKETPGFAFATATWHFSTEELPAEASGDLFRVTRTYFRRLHDGREWTLQPLADGAVLAPGDQVEVQLSIRARHAAEYVHLRDPRGAGFEPESLVSRFAWDLGLGYYEEVRDSGTNFFFESLPAGEYTFGYRLRAALGGTFRVGPATLQSMYAPEHTAYSAGDVLTVR